MTPRFVLSYSRRDRDSFLDRFFSDLRRELAIKEGLSTDPRDAEAGFRDTDAMAGGSDWSIDLARALREAWACVSLYSPNYFGREACGKELQVFLDRAGVKYDSGGAAEGSRGILPVLWASMQDLVRNGLPPSVVKRINFRSRRHQARYESDGLRHILRRSPRTVYVDILDDIVRDLIEGFKQRPEPLAQPPEFEKVKNAFLAATSPPAMASPPGGPGCVSLFLVVDSSSADELFGATADEAWKARAAEFDPRPQIEVAWIAVDAQPAPPLVDRLEDRSRRNTSIVVVVDPSAAGRHPEVVLSALRACLASPSWTGALVLPESAGWLQGGLSVPTENVDRLHLATAATVASLVADVRTASLEALRRVVLESSVQRHPPGGPQTSERPKVKGPSVGSPQ